MLHNLKVRYAQDLIYVCDIDGGDHGDGHLGYIELQIISDSLIYIVDIQWAVSGGSEPIQATTHLHTQNDPILSRKEKG